MISMTNIDFYGVHCMSSLWWGLYWLDVIAFVTVTLVSIYFLKPNMHDIHRFADYFKHISTLHFLLQGTWFFFQRYPFKTLYACKPNHSFIQISVHLNHGWIHSSVKPDINKIFRNILKLFYHIFLSKGLYYCAYWIYNLLSKMFETHGPSQIRTNLTDLR